MRAIIHANWLQGLEMLFDSAHVAFLHSAHIRRGIGNHLLSNESDYVLNNGEEEVCEFDERPYGFREVAIRIEPDSGRHVCARSLTAVLHLRPVRAERAADRLLFNSN